MCNAVVAFDSRPGWLGDALKSFPGHLCSCRRRRDKPLQPHVDDDVAVMLIVVGDVEHEDGAPKRLSWAHPYTSGHVDGLAEVGIGRLLETLSHNASVSFKAFSNGPSK